MSYDIYHNCGIRGIYGKIGLESMSMLKDLALRIESKYKKDGKWIITKRRETVYKNEELEWDKE